MLRAWFLIPTLALLTSLSGLAQSKSDCVLGSASNGQIIEFRGTVRSGPHDGFIDIENCEESVIYTFADYSDSDVPASQMTNDKAMRQFKKFQGATFGRTKSGGICGQCSKFDPVTADFRGKLEIAELPPGAKKDTLGRMWNSNGKFIGFYGWGHPVPLAKYRFVIFSVSNVTAKKLSRPQ